MLAETTHESAFSTSEGLAASVRPLMDVTDEAPPSKVARIDSNVALDGFATAKGDPVVGVSDAALSRARKLWDECKEDKSNLPKGDHPTTGFSTASGNPVRISDASLAKARKLWEESKEEACEDDVQAREITSSSPLRDATNAEAPLPKPLGISNKPGLVGFATAKGNPVGVSDAALSRARKLWDECKEDKSNVAKVNLPTSGFATASGNPVCISDDALARARKLWEESKEETSKDNIQQPEISRSGTPRDPTNIRVPPSKVARINNNTGPHEFATAKGDPVCVSHAALNKARKLWDDCKEDNTGLPEDSHANPGFTSAGGDSSRVPDDASTKSRKLWEEPKEETDEESSSNVFKAPLPLPPPVKTALRPRLRGANLPFKPPSRQAPKPPASLASTEESQEFEAEVGQWMEEIESKLV